MAKLARALKESSSIGMSTLVFAPIEDVRGPGYGGHGCSQNGLFEALPKTIGKHVKHVCRRLFLPNLGQSILKADLVSDWVSD